MRPCTRAAVPFVLAVPLLSGCSSGETSPADAEAPAHVEAPRPEAELTTVKLSADAVERLGIETAVVKTDTAATTRTLGGELMVPEGRLVTVTAPLAGTLSAVSALRPGTQVTRGTRLVTLTPLAAVDREQAIEARRAFEAAQADAEAARLRLQRLEQLLKDGAASVRSVEEARAQRQVTSAAVEAARERRTAIEEGPVGQRGAVEVVAPIDGVIQTISAAIGQTVAASAPLFQIAQVTTMWVRVPVFAGDVDRIDHAQAASVRRLGGAAGSLTGRQVTAPLRADATAASIDLYYELSGTTQQLRPGERVMVELPLTGTERGLVVPESAVLYDIHGDAWVYEDLGGNAYARRRVQIARHAGERAVVERGIAEGARVVTVGTAELFGTEFGAGH